MGEVLGFIFKGFWANLFVWVLLLCIAGSLDRVRARMPCKISDARSAVPPWTAMLRGLVCKNSFFILARFLCFLFMNKYFRHRPC